MRKYFRSVVADRIEYSQENYLDKLSVHRRGRVKSRRISPVVSALVSPMITAPERALTNATLSPPTS